MRKEDLEGKNASLPFRIAQICHEANKVYCEFLGDYSQKSWEEASEWQITSAYVGVCFVMDHPDALPNAQHEQWMRDKITDGWKYGPVKDEETKQHPCLVPYDELPREQRFKDTLFQTIAKTCLNVLK